MEEKENYGFCPACGANLPEGSSFCPECGHQIGGSTESGDVGYGTGYYNSSPTTRLQGKLKVAFIMVLIYAILSVLGAISLLTITEASIDQMDASLQAAGLGTFEEFMDKMGLDLTRGEFLDMCHISGVVELISGALCIVACVMMAKHTKRLIATILVAAAALVNFVTVTYNGVFSTIISVAIGCLMAYLIYTSPESFKDE